MRWMGREEEGENERSDLWTATMKCCSRWSQNQLGRHIARRPEEWVRVGRRTNGASHPIRVQRLT